MGSRGRPYAELTRRLVRLGAFGSIVGALPNAVVWAIVLIMTGSTMMLLSTRTRLAQPVPTPTVATRPTTPADLAGRGTSRAHRPNSVIYEEAYSFVERSGSRLLLDGQPYRFTGLNIYNANNLADCWYPLGAGPDLDSALTAIGPGQKVFRAWFFQYLATTNGQRDWSGFDHTLAVARQHGVRVIATFGNGWNDCEGATGSARYKTESWYQSGYRTLTTPGLTATYRNWVAEVVSRYKDNPTIFAWQLMNEASTPSDNGSGACTATSAATLRGFAQDLGGLVKGIDARHLLSLGTVGGGECGTFGADYQYVYSVPSIDLCEMHDYDPPSVLMPTDPTNGLPRRIAQCQALGKPLFVGETGIQVSGAGSAAIRASAFQARLAAQFQAGVAGELIWDWCDANQVAYSGYELGPGDPALQVLTHF